MDFFITRKLWGSGIVQVFEGKSSLPLMNRFEKHFFVPSYHKGAPLLGYNVSAVTGFFGSPGFFEVGFNGNGSTTLDYGISIESLLTPQELSMLQHEKKPERLKNNDGDLFFGGLLDHVKVINHDVLVGSAFRKQSDGTQKEEAYFMLLRKPL